LEDVQSANGTDPRSNFTLGGNIKAWKVLAELLDITLELAPMRSWQSKMLGRFPAGQSKKYSKAVAYAHCKELVDSYPVNKGWEKKRLEGITDAYLIALYWLKHKC